MCTAKPPHIPGYTWLAREVYDTPQSITTSQDQYITEVASWFRVKDTVSWSMFVKPEWKMSEDKFIINMDETPLYFD